MFLAFAYISTIMDSEGLDSKDFTSNSLHMKFPHLKIKLMNQIIYPICTTNELENILGEIYAQYHKFNIRMEVEIFLDDNNYIDIQNYEPIFIFDDEMEDFN